MKIGAMEWDCPLMLGPMAGYTDYAMRTVCRMYGADYLVTEMASAKAISFSDRKTIPLVRVRAEEAPCAVQLFGHEPEVLAAAAKWVGQGVGGGVRPAAIDLNMGCPVHKIVSNGDGSALMRHPELAERIVRAVAEATDLPVTVKIRAGWDESTINATEIARAVEAGGAQMICVHGRTRAQGYAGTVDYSVIAAVKRSVGIPVVGNGDVRDAASARRLLDETGCDGIMIGRGAVGNPFVFREVAAMLSGRDCPPPTPEERYETAMRQIALMTMDKGETVALAECRKQVGEYLAGCRGSAAARAALHTAQSVAEIGNILYACLSGEG